MIFRLSSRRLQGPLFTLPRPMRAWRWLQRRKIARDLPVRRTGFRGSSWPRSAQGQGRLAFGVGPKSSCFCPGPRARPCSRPPDFFDGWIRILVGQVQSNEPMLTQPSPQGCLVRQICSTDLPGCLAATWCRDRPPPPPGRSRPGPGSLDAILGPGAFFRRNRQQASGGSGWPEGARAWRFGANLELRRRETRTVVKAHSPR